MVAFRAILQKTLYCSAFEEQILDFSCISSEYDQTDFFTFLKMGYVKY